MADGSAWIRSTLTGDTALAALVSTRIYRDEAPEGTAFPYVIMQQIDAVPVQNAFKDRLMDGERWQIKAVNKANSYTTVNSIAARIEALLHKARGSNVVSSVLEFKLPMSEKDNGNTYKSMILDFRVHTQ
ncbi:MAG: DUF3168 domain-containing protein [Kiritimatiellia bacterium]